MRIEDLPTPALLLDLDRLESNLRRMAERARSLGVALRPHIKTHKCVEIAERQQALGALGITVSTLYEAAVFASHGFSDQTWAFPLNPSRMGELAELCDTIRLGVLVDSLEASGVARQRGHQGSGLDQGGLRLSPGRRGSGGPRLPRRSLWHCKPLRKLEFAGLLSHSGQAYDAGSPAEIGVIAEHERTVMCTLAGRLRDAGIEVSGSERRIHACDVASGVS